ncbi:hypothetical protein [Granulicella arctica]|uniref:hypothetical protein n=1 Tax=Granulicella arctica TaxID=940613 RepID=UPI0021DF6F34|nr:hypothetical protein [Granulicella arctica]
MQKICHRCGGDLPSGDGIRLFCPHCGSPQLYLSEDYFADQAPVANADTTGALPPPLPRQVDWQAAFRCSAIVAAIAAALLILSLRIPAFSFLSTIWILTASTSTLALYHRRRPLAWMDAAVGARIGLTAGAAVILLTGISMAIAGLVARFGLHAMAGFDAGFAQILTQAKVAASQTAAAQPAEIQAEILKFYDLPEFQSGILLATMAFMAILLLLFSTFGGAVNGLLRTRRRARL